MFEFSQLCNAFEKLSPAERSALLAEKSLEITAKLRLSGADLGEPSFTLACFILGSIVADGKVDEREYLLMYPALVRLFGNGFDFATVKNVVESAEGKKTLKNCTDRLAEFLSDATDDVKEDILTLCLCVVAIDGKISLKERKYVKQLCKA